MTKHPSSRRSVHRLLLATALAVTPYLANAQTTYYSDIVSQNWANQTWVPAGVPGTTDGTPSTDSVTIDKNSAAAGELRLIDHRNVANFARFRAVDSVGGSIRLLNNINSDIKLTVEDLFSVESGYLYLRAHHNYAARFTVETNRMLIGSTEWNGGLPGSGSMGVLYFSGLVGERDYSRVTLQVNETFTIVGNGRFVYEGVATGDAQIDLGDVVFQNNVTSEGEPMTPMFSLGTAVSGDVEHRVKLRSIQSEAANSSGVTVTGGATLELYGDTPSEPKDYRFYGEIQETTRLEKTGSNTQILSRSGGNSYSGGTLISAGTLMVENSTGSGLGTGSVTVEGTGTLGGKGRIALATQETITVKSGGTLAPGKDGEVFNTLRIVTAAGSTAPTLSMEEGSRFSFTIGEGNVSSAIEFLNYTSGALALASGGIEIAIDGPLTAGVYQLLVFREGGEGSALVSSGFNSGLFVNSPSEDYSVTLHYNDAAFGGPGVIAMEVTAVPEPSTVAFLLGGVGFLCLRQLAQSGKAL